MALRQLPAAWARSASVRGAWRSFSAPAKSEVVTSGPAAGAVPNAGGMPGVELAGGFWASVREGTAAAARSVSDDWARNWRRDFLLDMNWPLDAIVDGGILAREGINVACATFIWRGQF